MERSPALISAHTSAKSVLAFSPDILTNVWSVMSIADRQNPHGGRPCRPFQRASLLVNFHLVEHLDKLGVAVIHDLAVAHVQPGDLRHIIVSISRTGRTI